MGRRTRRKLNCDFCGKKIERQPTLINKTNFCSKECQNEFHRKRMSHEGNPRWEGGIAEEDRPIEWCEALKRKIRMRDGFICIKCGNKGLDVHHIDKDKMNNQEGNLITLCHGCHMKYHSLFGKNRVRDCEYWENSFWNWVGMHFENVEQAKTEEKEHEIYSIEVEKNHNFIANNFLTHNTIIVDETDLIDDLSYGKIYRMLVENPNAQIIEIGNPWFLAHFYEHHHSEDWEKIKISWQDCVKAGRMTNEAIADQRKELTELEFKVLFDADFPDEVEHAVFRKEAIEAMTTLGVPEKYEKIFIGVDVARGGRDRTVITTFGTVGNRAYFLKNDIRDTNDTMAVVGATTEMADQYISAKLPTEISIDTVGMGAGVYDRLVELNYDARAFIAGEKAMNTERFYNRKTEVAFKVAEIAKEGLIFNIPRDSRYTLESRAMTFEVRSDRQRKVIDPEDKSPDFFDSMMIALSRFVYHEDAMVSSFEDERKPEYMKRKPPKDLLKPRNR